MIPKTINPAGLNKDKKQVNKQPYKLVLIVLPFAVR